MNITEAWNHIGTLVNASNDPETQEALIIIRAEYANIAIQLMDILKELKTESENT